MIGEVIACTLSVVNVPVAPKPPVNGFGKLNGAFPPAATSSIGTLVPKRSGLLRGGPADKNRDRLPVTVDRFNALGNSALWVSFVSREPRRSMFGYAQGWRRSTASGCRIAAT